MALCLTIYFRTRDLYELSGEKSIYFFRWTFLYFALAYIFRLIPSLEVIFRTDIDKYFPFWFHPFGLLMTGFFSFMAILSLWAAVFSSRLKAKNSMINVYLLAFSFFFSVLVFVTNSTPVLLILQTLIFIGTAAGAIIIAVRGHKSLTFSMINYLLLLLAWLINIVAFSRLVLRHDNFILVVGVSLGARILLYLVSTAIFTSLFIRIIKRLPVNAKKKRTA